ncbi:MAG TPA: DsrE/DsrF/DrsH-like family protein [Anaerolineae bacterium]|nr:DsrE/DsrF/DrsH-like family protein [Anaerolineae bacterium]
MSEDTQKCSIVVFSGDMDKVMAAFIIATTAAAMGRETSMFFTFWGIKAIQKGNLTGESFLERMLGLMNRGGIDRIGPSRFNFGGMGRWMFKKMMKDQGVASLAELREMAIDLGVKLIACDMSMDVMGISREDLIDEVADVAGAATYCSKALEGQALFI